VGESILPRAVFESIFFDSAIRDKKLERVKTLDVLLCQSAMILMGCSSGRLVSMNFPRDEIAPTGNLHYEPDGAITSYLCADAPCVVGNLWDVTDRDIDR
jgi:hypothetical protein